MVEFLHGTSESTPNGTIYNGVTFATSSALLTYFKDTLSTAGWTVVLDDIATNKLLKLSASDNGDNCYMNFSVVEINSTTFDLTMQGDVDGTGKTANDANTQIFLTQRVKANTGRLYITASDRSFAFLSVEKTLPSIPYYGGFPERDDPNDAGAWGFGKLNTRMSEKYIATSIGQWRSLREFYYASSEPATFTSSNQGCYEGVMDRYTVNLFGASQTNSASQSAYKPENGALGLDGKAKIGTYRLKRGNYLQGSYANVDNEGTPTAGYGDIDFAVVGLASLPAGDQFVTLAEEPNTGYTAKEYVRRTYITGDVGTQGFLINEERQATPFA